MSGGHGREQGLNQANMSSHQVQPQPTRHRIVVTRRDDATYAQEHQHPRSRHIFSMLSCRRVGLAAA